ncbi:hypothetical protein SAMN05216178_5558 [Pseudomonas saponiphila]|uniref:Uncharacterized protein n=1 Tax=Pseudomonas saponiphila TaxID=556534 RepID=A0A1H4WT99_9PSED|nr:hypothetical protein SAMN05216178_5558 [Pseudomonas saponiphila]
MALVGRRDGRNFGYGRQLSYAGPQALKDMLRISEHRDRPFRLIVTGHFANA